MMSEQGYSFERDLKEAQAMVEGLVPYVYEDELYGKLGMNMPRLTIGGLLMRLRRLRALAGQMNAADKVALLDTRHASVCQEWTLAYNRKLLREAESRMRDMQTYFGECRDDPKLGANAYLPEAQRRTILHEIAAVLSPSELEQSKLDSKLRRVDSDLRRVVRPSEFVWATVLKTVYPAETFWWLYQRPPQPNDNRDSG
jgi:hypothetical protein